MEQFQYKNIFFNYEHSFINDYLNKQEDYIRLWQVNVERVQHGQGFGFKVPPMTNMIKGLLDQWEIEYKRKMRLLNFSELQGKIAELEAQYEKIFQCRSIFAHKFANIQMQTISDKKAPCWVEVPNAVEEEEFNDNLYIKLCTIQPFDQEIQNAARRCSILNQLLKVVFRIMSYFLYVFNSFGMQTLTLLWCGIASQCQNSLSTQPIKSANLSLTNQTLLRLILPKFHMTRFLQQDNARDVVLQQMSPLLGQKMMLNIYYNICAVFSLLMRRVQTQIK